MRVHVYRNRPDDDRPRNQMHFCYSCVGWYGVPHDNSHCQQRLTAKWQPEHCACRFCREATSQPVEGSHGYFTEALMWQPLTVTS